MNVAVLLLKYVAEYQSLLLLYGCWPEWPLWTYHARYHLLRFGNLHLQNQQRILGPALAIIGDLFGNASGPAQRFENGVTMLLIGIWMAEQQGKLFVDITTSISNEAKTEIAALLRLIGSTGAGVLDSGSQLITQPLKYMLSGQMPSTLYEAGSHAAAAAISTVAQSVHSTQQRTVWAAFYRYMPLNAGEIRMVEIEAGLGSSVIRCAIVHDQLNKYRAHSSDDRFGTTYEALSYTWGNSTKKESIELFDRCSSRSRDITGNAQSFRWLHVTSNCAAALRRLRHKSEKRRVWIDAICIDQSNIAERNSQVRLMAQIYRNARRAIVYLGDASVKESDAISTLIYLHQSKSLCVSDLLHDERVGAVQHLLARPWFSRIWVLQEVYMATSAVALFGVGSYSWTNLVSMLHESKRLLWNLIQIPLPYAIQVQDDNLCAKNLFDLLCRSRHCAATDPRDKYFALLSMVEDAETNDLAADYSKDVSDIFTKLAIYLLEHIGLDFLTAVEGSFGSGTLPSWVPDWSSSTGLGHLPQSKDIVKRAGGARERATFRLETRYLPDPDVDTKLMDLLLEADGLEEEYFATIFQDPDFVMQHRSERASSIVVNWDGRSQDHHQTYEEMIEHRGGAEGWSNFPRGTGIHLNPTPEDWSVVVGQYCMDAKIPTNGNDSLQMPVFTISGVSVDTVEYVTPVCALAGNDISETIAKWYRDIRDHISEPDEYVNVDFDVHERLTSSSLSQEHRILDSFYRAITWEAMHSYTSLKLDDTTNIDSLPHERIDLDTDLAGFSAAVQLATTNRMIFITTDKRLGLCPAETQIGDEVAVFCGAVYPCVLRKVAQSSCFNLVGGNCYLQGIMDGEMIQEKTKLEEFVIW